MKIFKLLVSLLRPALSVSDFVDPVGGAVGMAAGASQLFGGSPTVPGNEQWLQAMMQLMQAIQGTTGQISPVLKQAFERMLAIDPSALATSGARAGTQYGDIANLGGQYSRTLGDQAGREFSAGQDVYNLGRDPQSQLHDFLRQQTVEDARAGDTARGIAMSPFSSGTEADATRRFEMDWQRNLLDRSLTGLSGMEGANRMGGADLSGSMQFAGMVPEATMASAAAPIKGATAAAQFPAEAATTYGGQVGSSIYGPWAGLMSQIMPYLGQGFGGATREFDYNRQAGGLAALLGGMSQFAGPGSWLGSMGGGTGAAALPAGAADLAPLAVA